MFTQNTVTSKTEKEEERRLTMTVVMFLDALEHTRECDYPGVVDLVISSIIILHRCIKLKTNFYGDRMQHFISFHVRTYGLGKVDLAVIIQCVRTVMSVSSRVTSRWWFGPSVKLIAAQGETTVLR